MEFLRHCQRTVLAKAPPARVKPGASDDRRRREPWGMSQ